MQARCTSQPGAVGITSAGAHIASALNQHRVIRAHREAGLDYPLRILVSMARQRPRRPGVWIDVLRRPGNRQAFRLVSKRRSIEAATTAERLANTVANSECAQ